MQWDLFFFKYRYRYEGVGDFVLVNPTQKNSNWEIRTPPYDHLDGGEGLVCMDSVGKHVLSSQEV